MGVVMRFALVLLIVSAALSVHAHGNLSHRHGGGTFRVQEGGHRTLDLMLTLSLVGPRATHIISRFDLNRDGQFSERETLLFQRELKNELEGGLFLRCVGSQPIKPTEIQYKSSQKDRRTLLFAGLFTYTLPNECAHLIFEAAAGAQRKGLEALKVQLSAYPPIQIGGAQRMSFELMPGSASVVRVPMTKEF